MRKIYGSTILLVLLATMVIQPVNAAEVYRGNGAFTGVGFTGDLNSGTSCNEGNLNPAIDYSTTNWTVPSNPGWKLDATVTGEANGLQPGPAIRSGYLLACGYIGRDLRDQDVCREHGNGWDFRAYGGFGKLVMNGEVLRIRDIEWVHTLGGAGINWTGTTLDSQGHPAGIVSGLLNVTPYFWETCQGAHTVAGTFSYAGCTVEGVSCKP